MKAKRHSNNNLITLKIAALIVFAALVILPGCGRQAALARKIPWDKINSPQKENAKLVIKNYTLANPIENLSFEGNVKIYNYMLDRLPLTAKIIRAMRTKEYYAVKTPDGRIHAWNDTGIDAYITEMYRTENERIYFVTGSFNNKSIKNLTGKAVIIWKYNNEPNNRIHNEADLFIFIDQKPMRSLSKIMRPFIGKLVKRKLAEIVGVTRMVSIFVYTNPKRIYDAMIAEKARAEITDDELKEFYDTFIAPLNTEKSIDKPLN